MNHRRFNSQTQTINYIYICVRDNCSFPLLLRNLSLFRLLLVRKNDVNETDFNNFLIKIRLKNAQQFHSVLMNQYKDISMQCLLNQHLFDSYTGYGMSGQNSFKIFILESFFSVREL